MKRAVEERQLHATSNISSVHHASASDTEIAGDDADLVDGSVVFTGLFAWLYTIIVGDCTEDSFCSEH